MNNTIRIVLSLGMKEADILLLAKQYNLKNLVIQAVNNYLTHSSTKIALPSMQQVSPKRYTICLNESDDENVYRFILSIPKGFRVIAVKLLLRHSLEQCDLRFLTDYPQNIVPQKKPKESQSHTNIPARVLQKENNQTMNNSVPTVEKQENHHKILPLPDKSANADDIFDLI